MEIMTMSVLEHIAGFLIGCLTVLILVIAGLAAKALANLVRGAAAEAGLSNPDLLANIAQMAVMAFAIVVAVNQIGVATTLVNTLFMGTVAALSIAFGLAFGLGGRDTAAEIVRNWYRQGQQAAPKMADAADAAKRRSEVAASTIDGNNRSVRPATART